MRGRTLTIKEQTRLQILNGVLERRWSMPKAAELLGVSERHAWRLLAAYREEGAAALAHGNRGRLPANATPAATRQQVVRLAQERYGGINHTHLTELLAEREGIVLSRSTLRRVLVGAGQPSPRHRRPPHHRCRRQRMPQEGMLLQLDGSPHAWLEARGPWLTLLLAVDDATGTVPYALFRQQEDTEGYFHLLQGVIQRRGIPLGVYTNRYTVFRHPGQRLQEEAQIGKLTQFGRALEELGVNQVFAHSPEAKGRVERANGTFQDRLVAELRLAGASNLAEANQVLETFLPRFNERFGVPAAQPESAYRQPDPELDVAGILCIKERRRVARDNTVQYHGLTLQLFPGTDRPSYARAWVEVQERLDGQLLVSYRGQILTPQEAPPLATQLRARAEAGPAVAILPEPDPPVVRAPRGPLAGEPIWYEDPTRKRVHRDLVQAGMERARQQGKQIGRPRVTQREGFWVRWQGVLGRLQAGALSRRDAALELGIGYATLKRLLDSTTELAQTSECTIKSVATAAWGNPAHGMGSRGKPQLQAKENGTAGNTPDVPSPPTAPI